MVTHFVLLYQMKIFAVIFKAVFKIATLLFTPKGHGGGHWCSVHAVPSSRLPNITTALQQQIQRLQKREEFQPKSVGHQTR